MPAARQPPAPRQLTIPPTVPPPANACAVRLRRRWADYQALGPSVTAAAAARGSSATPAGTGGWTSRQGRTLERQRVEDLIDRAVLVASELVTSAVVHAEGPLRRLQWRQDRLHVAVYDQLPRLLRLAGHPGDLETGVAGAADRRPAGQPLGGAPSPQGRQGRLVRAGALTRSSGYDRVVRPSSGWSRRGCGQPPRDGRRGR